MYRIFDQNIDSEVPLPELPRSKGVGRTIRFRVGVSAETARDRRDWIWRQGTPSGGGWLCCAPIERGYLLRFETLADFSVDRAEDSISCCARPGTPPETLRHLLLDHVMPRFFGQDGRLVVHASAVLLAEGAIAFLGESGWGKSTLAASFHSEGGLVVTDDCLLIEARDDGVVTGIPTYSASRLWPDAVRALFPERSDLVAVSHYSTKKRLVLGGTSVNGTPTDVPLDAVFLLDDPRLRPSDEVSVEVVSGAETVMSLVRRGFLLDGSDRRAVERQFEHAGEIKAAGLRVFSLRYPRRHELLPQVREAVRKALRPTS